MTLSAGILILILSPGVILCKKRWSKIYPILLSLFGLLYHHFLSVESSFVVEFFGFKLNLSSYRLSGDILTYAFLIFGLCVYIFLWSKEKDRFYYMFTLWQVGAAAAILFVGDFLSFFIFWEVISLSSVCILFREAGLSLTGRYFIYQMFGTVSLLIGIGLNYAHTGGMDLQVNTGQLFFWLAIMVKGGVIPFHYWLTSIYPEIRLETTVFLSAYTTKVGIYSLAILLPLMDLQIFGGLIAVIGVIYALKQHRMSRLLAFHLISQMGYVIASINSQIMYGQIGAIYHLINNIFYKGLLFMVAALLMDLFQTDDLMIIRGRGRRYLPLFIITLIAAGSIVGLPGLNGFISKSLIKKGLTNSLTANLLTIAGIGTALSFIKVLYYGFLCVNDQKQSSNSLRVNWHQYVSMSIIGLVCCLIGLFPFLVISRFDLTVNLFNWTDLWKGIWPIILAVILFITCFPQLNKLILQITPDLEGVFVTARRIILVQINLGLKHLQRLHSGNVQHYLVWIVLTILILWTYIAIMV